MNLDKPPGPVLDLQPTLLLWLFEIGGGGCRHRQWRRRRQGVAGAVTRMIGCGSVDAAAATTLAERDSATTAVEAAATASSSITTPPQPD